MTAFDGHRAIWMWQFDQQAEHDIRSAAATAQIYANADILLVKAMDGPNWMSQFDAYGLVSLQDLKDTVDRAETEWVNVIPWVVPHGRGDMYYYAAVAAVNRCIMFDIEPYPGFWQDDVSQIGPYLASLKNAMPSVEVHVSIDPRPQALDALDLESWATIVDGLHPQCYWTDFQEPPAQTAGYLDRLVQTGVRVYPVMPGNAAQGEDFAAFWGPGAWITSSTGATGASLWRMGSANIANLEWFSRCKVGGQ